MLLSHTFRPKPTPLKKLSLDSEIYWVEHLIHVPSYDSSLYGLGLGIVFFGLTFIILFFLV